MPPIDRDFNGELVVRPQPGERQHDSATHRHRHHPFEEIIVLRETDNVIFYVSARPLSSIDKHIFSHWYEPIDCEAERAAE